jgi:hypothetical protein
MSKVLVRTVIGLLLAAIFVIGAAASVATAGDGCGDPNTVVLAE